MLNILEIPEKCLYDRVIQKEKFFDSNNEELSGYVGSVLWHAVLRPENTGADKVMTSELRYEEIQIFQIEILKPETLFDIAHVFYKKIKYPCVLIFRYNGECEKYTFSACKFTAGKIDHDENILKRIVMSHWIHPDALSDKGKEFIFALNRALALKTNLYEIYTTIFNEISYFRISGTSRTHVYQLISDMGGYGKKEILKYCTPYKYYHKTYVPLGENYVQKKRRNTFSYIFDYEDLWYCFMKDEHLRYVIEHRRYRDIEDLVYSIDERYMSE